MSLKTTALALLASTAFAAPAFAAGGIPALNHVFVIMMENHGYGQVLNNPYAPFTQAEAASANLAKNYFAVAHPSLTNYLEVIGGSNFGVTDDNSPDWHNATCQPNIVSGINNNEADATPICPIAGIGMDAPTPAIDYSNETKGAPGVINIDGAHAYGAQFTTGASIADQLVDAKKTWKSYEEDLPASGADNVNASDGNFSNLTVFDANEQALGETNANVVALYAAKHNPFAYFASVQNGTGANSLANVAGYDGPNGLYADLATGHVPNFSFIAPNQCNDQHGRSNSTVFCQFDPADNGTQTGLNPAGIALGDQELQKLVTAIKASPVWSRGHNAIVILWDEDDYSVSPTVNRVALIVDTNYGSHGKTSAKYYTHFSLLKTIEYGFGLDCLNHACDASTAAITDLFN
jgi:hypothetical protein